MSELVPSENLDKATGEYTEWLILQGATIVTKNQPELVEIDDKGISTYSWCLTLNIKDTPDRYQQEILWAVSIAGTVRTVAFYPQYETYFILTLTYNEFEKLEG